jgi:hypothetical protein
MGEICLQFEKTHDSHEYESKVAGLLLRAFERDCEVARRVDESDPRETWRAAHQILSTEDHCIFIMIDAKLAPNCAGNFSAFSNSDEIARGD